MEITEVRVRQVQDTTDRLKAFCTVTFDDQFVVRDIKVVEGSSGLFVSMPSRKATTACGKCGHRNQIRARFCEECGARMGPQEAAPTDANGRSKLHRDIAHPITPEFREMLQARVLEAYHAELAHAPQGDDKEPEDEDVDEPAPRAAMFEEAGEEPEEEDRQPERLVSEYDDLIAGLRGSSGSGEGRSEPRGRGEDRGYGGQRGHGERRGGERSREQSRGGYGDRGGQGESRGRGGYARPAGGDRGRGPREGDRGGRGREGGGFSRSGGEGTRRGRDAGPPRKTGSSQGVRYLRDEQPPRSPGSLPHGERGSESRFVPREPSREAAPRETPREAPSRDVPKEAPPAQISLKEADERFAVDAGGDDDTPFGAGL